MGRGNAFLMTTDAFTFDEATHCYRLNGQVLPSITQSIAAAGLIDTEWYTQRGRERGVAVHDATMMDDEAENGDYELDEESLDDVCGDDGIPLFSPGELLSYVEGWRAFRRAYEFEPTLIEEPLYHKVHLFAGRIDRAGFIKHNRRRTKCVVEIKTGASVGATAEQTAAQVHLLENPPSWSRFEVRVMKEGKYKLSEFGLRDLPRDFGSFLSTVQVARRQIELFGKIREQISNGGRQSWETTRKYR